MPGLGLNFIAGRRAASTNTKDPCRLATTANIANPLTAAPLVVDGGTVVAGDRILVKDQADQAQNGIFSVITPGSGSDGVWARSSDFDEDAEVKSGVHLFVEEGTVNDNTGWQLMFPR